MTQDRQAQLIERRLNLLENGARGDDESGHSQAAARKCAQALGVLQMAEELGFLVRLDDEGVYMVDAPTA